MEDDDRNASSHRPAASLRTFRARSTEPGAQEVGPDGAAAAAARGEIRTPDQAAAEALADDDPEAILRALDEWRLRRMLEARSDRYVPACAVGIRHAQAGQPDEAIRQLRIAFDERSAFMPMIEISPALASLHGDPRFQELARQVKARMRGAI